MFFLIKMINLSLELIQNILEFLDLKNQIILKSLCKNYYDGLRIYDFYNISRHYKDKLNDEILKSYSYVKYLDASNNFKITNINHMTNLKKLNASRNCGINNEGIKNLNLIKLDMNNNISNKELKNLNLIKLSLVNNDKIKNLNHMTKLKKLNASAGNCIISDKSIKGLNLIELQK